MKTIKQLLLSVILITFMASCGQSTDEIRDKVKADMEQKFKGKGIIIKSFKVTKKTGNEYKGVMETSELYGNYSYEVDIVCDGDKIAWVTKLAGEN